MLFIYMSSRIFFCSIWVGLFCCFTLGCGVTSLPSSSSSSNPVQPVSGQTTKLTLMSSATAGSRLTSYMVRFRSLDLVNQNGKVAPCFPLNKASSFFIMVGLLSPALLPTFRKTFTLPREQHSILLSSYTSPETRQTTQLVYRQISQQVLSLSSRYLFLSL